MPPRSPHPESRPFDAIVIGGSFAGLSAAMQLARARRRVCVIDAGQPRNRFAARSHGFFGRDGMPPLEMIAEAQAKVAAYATVSFRIGKAVAAKHEAAGYFSVSLESGEVVMGTKLVLACGVQDDLPELPGLAERWGHTVVHCPYCHGHEFGGAPLGVLNVVPGSVHQALLVPDWGPTTFFLNGGPAPDAETLRKLSLRNVTLEAAPVEALEGAPPGLTGVRLKDGRVIAVAGLFIAPQVRQSPLATQLGCAIDEGPQGPLIRTDPFKLTTVPGVYAAGDAAVMPHNATLASADGVMAGAGVHRSLIFDLLEPPSREIA